MHSGRASLGAALQDCAAQLRRVTLTSARRRLTRPVRWGPPRRASSLRAMAAPRCPRAPLPAPTVCAGFARSTSCDADAEAAPGAGWRRREGCCALHQPDCGAVQFRRSRASGDRYACQAAIPRDRKGHQSRAPRADVWTAHARQPGHDLAQIVRGCAVAGRLARLPCPGAAGRAGVAPAGLADTSIAIRVAARCWRGRLVAARLRGRSFPMRRGEVRVAYLRAQRPCHGGAFGGRAGKRLRRDDGPWRVVGAGRTRGACAGHRWRGTVRHRGIQGCRGAVRWLCSGRRGRGGGTFGHVQSGRRGVVGRGRPRRCHRRVCRRRSGSLGDVLGRRTFCGNRYDRGRRAGAFGRQRRCASGGCRRSGCLWGHGCHRLA